ncbi:MAG: Wzz/FepE/Etk N-terminal domain-containing protein, partial [Chloroflexi bacterium]|nr:Wzz/FepE/Etk N-terminal domain-containing protein [Chloroflexota bacterium]
MELNGTMILRRWRTVVQVAILGALLALLATYILPQKYQATTSLLIRANNVRIFSGNGQPAVSPNDYSQTTALLVKTIDQTQAAMISSRTIAEQVVRQLHLDHPKPPANWFAALKSDGRLLITVVLDLARYGYYKQPPPFEGAVSEVQNSLTAEPIQNSYILNVKALASSPEEAAAIANAAAEAFITYSQQVYGQEAKNHTQFIKSEVARAQQAVAQAAQQLSQYKEKHHLPSVANQLQLDVTTVNAAKTTLRQNQEQLAAAQARLDRIKKQLQQTPPTVQQTQDEKGQTSSTTTGGEQTVTETSQQHSSGGSSTASNTQQSTVTGQGTSSSEPNAPKASSNPNTPPSTATSGRFGASKGTSSSSQTAQSHNTSRTVTSPTDVSSHSTQKVTTKPSVSNQKSAQTQTVTMPNPVYQSLLQTQQKTEQDIAAFEADNAQLASAIQTENAALNVFPSAESALSQLQLQLDAANSTYLKLRGEYEDALITEAQSINDLTIVDRAVPPLYPIKPLKFLYVLLGLLIGIVAGSAIGIGQEYLQIYRQSQRASLSPKSTPRAIPTPNSDAAFTND